MAGGQERILRRRIKSRPVDQEDHAAMELIAASRGSSRPSSASHAAVPVQRADHRGHPQPRRGRRRGSTARCSSRATEIAHGRLRRRSPPTAACAGGYNTGVIRAAEREMQADAGRGSRLRARPRRQEGRGLLPVPRLPHRRSRSPASPTARPTRTPARSPAHVVERVRARRGRPGRARLHAVHLGRHPARSCVGRSCRSTTDGRSRRRRRPTSGRSADYEFEPEPDGDPRPAAAALRRGPVFAALLDAAASEHAARQRAMKSATDNAEELITHAQPRR